MKSLIDEAYKEVQQNEANSTKDNIVTPRTEVVKQTSMDTAYKGSHKRWTWSEKN